MVSNKVFILCAYICILSCGIATAQDSLQQRINYYISQAKLDSAKSYIEKQLENTRSEKGKVKLDYELVKVLYMQSDYEAALKEAFRSLDNTKDKEQRAKLNFMIGVLYSSVADYSQAISYYDLVTNNSASTSLKLQTHLLTSQLHIEQRDTLKGRASLKYAYDITTTEDVDPKMSNHVAMQYHFYEKNYEQSKALNYITIADSTSFLNSKSFAYSMIGDCLVNQDSLKKSISYYEEFLQLTILTKDPEQVKIAANKLIEVYEQLGNQEKANTYHKVYNDASSDSLSFSPEKYKDIYTIEKNRELSLLENKISKRNFIILGSILLLICTAFFFYFRNKKVRDQYKKSKSPGKKIQISDTETQKIRTALEKLIESQSYLTSNITRKSFCNTSDIKTERYLSQYINEKYNKSFTSFINDLRITYAYNRLRDDAVFRSYKIEEVAKASGFGSKKSFERAFLANYNQSPYKFISSLTS